jgi:hypothetical protein
MSYLIYNNSIDASERNHEEALRRFSPTYEPKNIGDPIYWWNMVIHPTTGEAALEIPAGADDLTDEDEIAALVETMPADWQPKEKP